MQHCLPIMMFNGLHTKVGGNVKKWEIEGPNRKCYNSLYMNTIPKSHKHPLTVNFWVVLLFVMTIPMFGSAQNANLQADSSKTVYIPIDLPDCMRQLDSILPPEDKELIRSLEEKNFLSRTHLALGMWIRNNWGLWAGSRLATYFDEQGIHHPDDMSGAILRCYYHYVKGEKVNYQQMLRKERRQEEQWAKKQEKSRKKE